MSEYVGKVWKISSPRFVGSTVPTPPWSSRIPAAIAKAEELVGDEREFRTYWMDNREVPVTITATEVVLAKALWEAHQSLALEYGERVEIVPPALRDFCTKVESLD